MHETLQFDKFEDSENMTIPFQTYNLKYPNKTLWHFGPNFFFHYFFLFCTIFCILAKFKRGDSKHHNHFFQFLCLKIPNRTFLVWDLRIFFFVQNLKLTTQNCRKKSILSSKIEAYFLVRLAPNIRICF